MSGNRAGRTGDIICIAALAAVCVLFFHPALLRGRAFVPADLLSYLSPWQQARSSPPSYHNSAISDGIFQYYTDRVFFTEEIRAGRVPLWNSGSFCGQPFAANNKSAVFYPLNTVFALVMQPWRAAGFSAALHAFLSGVFMFLFLRVWRLDPWPSALGGAAFMLNGWAVGYMQITSLFNSGIWLPLALCLYEISLRRGGLRAALLAGAVLGMQLTAGFLQVSAYVLLLFAGYAAWRCFIEAREGRGVARAAGFAALAALVGLCMAAVQILPTLDLLPFSNRAAAGLAKAEGSGIAPWQLSPFFSPDFLGSPPYHKVFFQAGSYIEWNAYTSVCALFLAAAGVAGAARRGAPRGPVLFFAAAGAVALLMACGTPLYALFHYAFPGGALLRANRFLYLLPPCIAVCAACGAHEFSRARAGVWRGGRVAVSSVAVLAAAGVCFLLSARALMDTTGIPADVLVRFESGPLSFFGIFAVLTLAVLAAGRRLPENVRGAALAALVAADLFFWGQYFNTYVDRGEVYPVTGSIKFMQERRAEEPFRVHSYDFNALPPNSAAVYGLEDVRGYDSIYPGGYARLIEALAPPPPGTPRDTTPVVNTAVIDSPLIDFMGVKYIAAPGTIVSDRFKLAYTGEINVYENPRALPRAFMAGGWRVEANDQDPVLDVASKNFSPADDVLLATEPPGLPRAGKGVYSAAKVRYPSPGEVVIDVEARAPGVLVLSDQWDGGWRAAVDGKEEQVLRANVAFRAVAIPSAGRHEVRMVYEPRGVKYGGAVSLGAMILTLCAAAGLTPRGKNPAGKA